MMCSALTTNSGSLDRSVVDTGGRGQPRVPATRRPTRTDQPVRGASAARRTDGRRTRGTGRRHRHREAGGTATDGPFTHVGRAIDEFFAGLATAVGSFAQLVVQADEFTELGRNPYTALAVSERALVADAHDRFDEMVAWLRSDQQVDDDDIVTAESSWHGKAV